MTVSTVSVHHPKCPHALHSTHILDNAVAVLVNLFHLGKETFARFDIHGLDQAVLVRSVNSRFRNAFHHE